MKTIGLVSSLIFLCACSASDSATVANLSTTSQSPGSLPSPSMVHGTPSVGAQHLFAAMPHASVADYGAKCDGVTDDSAAFQAAIDATAGHGVMLMIPACAQPYVIGTPLRLRSNVTIAGTLGAALKSNIAPSGIIANSLFYAAPTPSVDGRYLGALHAAAVIGTAAVTVDAAPAPVVGQWLRITHGFSTQIFLVRAVTDNGGGNYDVALDRPIGVPFASGDSIDVYASIPTGIFIDGGGMDIGGTGDLYAELFACWRCTVRNINFTSSFGSLRSNTFWASYDEGSRDSSFENLNFDGSGNSPGVSGPVAEAGENIRIRGIGISNASGNGPALIDCLRCGLEEVYAANVSGWGEAIGTQGESFGSIDSWIDNGYSESTAGPGVIVDKSLRARVNNVVAVGCKEGAHIYTTAVGAIVSGITTDDSAIDAVGNDAAGTIVARLSAHETNGPGHNALTSAAEVALDGFSITAGGAEAFTGIGVDLAGASSTVSNGRVTLSAPDRVALVARTGTTAFSNVKVATLQDGTIGLYVETSATARIGPSDDLNQCSVATYGPGTVETDSSL